MPVVVGVVGCTCSGKSTLASELAAALGAPAPLCQDDFFLFDSYLTDSCPQRQVGPRVWKDWESAEAIDWGKFTATLAEARGSAEGGFYVVEGFLLAARPETAALLDAVVELAVPPALVWERRLSRAMEMQHLPPGFSEGGVERNYEVVETYLPSGADPQAVHAAAAHLPHGNHNWMRLYFDEVLVPSLEAVPEFSGPRLVLDATAPPGRDAWLAARTPEAAAFVKRQAP